MEHLTVTEARARLSETLDRVSAGEEVTITRHGRAAAVLRRPEARVGRAKATLAEGRRIRGMLGDAAEGPLPPPMITADRAEELLKSARPTGCDVVHPDALAEP